MFLRHALCGAACLLFLSANSYGWGGEGHQIVALIAENHLAPATKAKIVSIIGKDQDMADAEFANWADRIRRERSETGGYHFVDIPADAKNYDPARDGNDGTNVIDALAKYVDVLRDESKPKADREEALRWVVHLAGDLQQPLHCAERNKDRGGNSVPVFLLDQKGKAGNLHSVWDSGILRTMIEKRPIAEYADSLDRKITPKQIGAWQAGNPIAWANESHDLAVKYVYAGVAADGPPVRLDETYVARARPVIEQQLERGGIRLAMILDRCFGDAALRK